MLRVAALQQELGVTGISVPSGGSGPDSTDMAIEAIGKINRSQ